MKPYRHTLLRLLILAATIPMVVAGCGLKHLVASSIDHGKAPTVINGKAYAYGDDLQMADNGGSSRTEHFCGEVIDFSGNLFPAEHHFAIAASNPSRDCGAAVRFFRDFLKPGNTFNPGGYWQGMEVDYNCGGTWSAGSCTPYKNDGYGYPGGFWAQTMNGSDSPYSNEHGYGGFAAMAVAF
jgi:hypothetical protein